MEDKLDITKGLLGAVDVPKTSEEITDESVPDPEQLPDVGGDWILVRPVKTHTERIGNIYIPDSTRGDVKYLHNVGRVLKIGSRAYKRADNTTVDWFEGGLHEGDIVQWERFVGRRIRYKGVNMVLVKDTALQLKISDPMDLDSMVNLEE